jgi:hypothetical protein
MTTGDRMPLRPSTPKTECPCDRVPLRTRA